jgi:hypothetical protein
MIEPLTDKEVAALDAGKCPDCGEENFYLGPQGGMNTNIECANKNCMARFNVVLGMAGSFGKERLGRPILKPFNIKAER